MQNKVTDLYLISLQSLVEVSDGTEEPNKSSITVACQGAVYSGSLVSEEAWRREILDNVLTASDTGTEVLSRVIESAAEQLSKISSKEENNGKLERYIHLIDAKLVSGAEVFDIAPVRIAISSVSAWSLGSFR
ncbi:hypothetical protein GCM10027417_30620 [Glutamicibacter endophyticus]